MREIRPLDASDEARLHEQIERDWGATRMTTRGRLVDVAALPGFVATDGDEWLGYATYELRDREMEVTTCRASCPTVA